MENNKYATWDPAAYAEMVQNVVFNYRHTNKPPRKFLFANTLEVLRRGGYTLADGREVLLGSDTKKMMASTKVYKEEFDVSDVPAGSETKMWVEKQDCLLVGKRLTESGLKLAVLNFASQKKGCGDMHLGVDGQQQDILRRTDLIMSHAQISTPEWAKRVGVNHIENVFPLDRKFGCIYNPGVSVFRHNLFYAFDYLEAPFQVDVISCGAVDREKDCTSDAEWDELTRERMRTIFRVGLANGNDALVLGGWGCSTYKNAPEATARLFQAVANEPEFKNKYKVIVFSCLAKAKRGKPFGKFQPFADLFGDQACYP